MRRDAIRNQRLVLDAARDVLAEEGTEAGMESIAARAGVGIGTVYRHFPNKDALIDALVGAIVEDLVGAATSALERPRGGLEEFLNRLGESLARHRGYARMLVGHGRSEQGSKELRELIAQLTDRARDAGEVGAWVTFGDVMVTVWAVRGIIDTSGAVAESAWRRHLDIHLMALRAPAFDPRESALTPGQLAEIAADPR